MFFIQNQELIQVFSSLFFSGGEEGNEKDQEVLAEGPPVDVDDETSDLAGEEDKDDMENKSMPESEVDGPGELHDNSADLGPPDCE